MMGSKKSYSLGVVGGAEKAFENLQVLEFGSTFSWRLKSGSAFIKSWVSVGMDFCLIASRTAGTALAMR
jgi:hypothetical protein